MKNVVFRKPFIPQLFSLSPSCIFFICTSFSSQEIVTSQKKNLYVSYLWFSKIIYCICCYVFPTNKVNIYLLIWNSHKIVIWYSENFSINHILERSVQMFLKVIAFCWRGCLFHKTAQDRARWSNIFCVEKFLF